MEILINTSKKEEALDITDKVEEVIKGKQGKFCIVYCPHTTAGLLINEGYDEDVMSDILNALDKTVVPKVDGTVN